jgi:hypothetical protein
MLVDILTLPQALQHRIFELAGPAALTSLCQTCKKADDAVSASEVVWLRSCQRRWGSLVPVEAVDSYKEYFLFRSSRWRCPRSPLNMFQEEVSADPWRTIASCVLRSRTSGSALVADTVKAFFERYPTASDVANGDLTDMGALLFPLGLHRETTIVRTAAGFLSSAFTGGAVSDLFGCGAFCEDSHSVFCLGDLATVAKSMASDRNVRAFAAWAMRHAKPSPAGAHAPSSAATSAPPTRAADRTASDAADAGAPCRRRSTGRERVGAGTDRRFGAGDETAVAACAGPDAAAGPSSSARLTSAADTTRRSRRSNAKSAVCVGIAGASRHSRTRRTSSEGTASGLAAASAYAAREKMSLKAASTAAGVCGRFAVAVDTGVVPVVVAAADVMLSRPTTRAAIQRAAVADIVSGRKRTRRPS